MSRLDLMNYQLSNIEREAWRTMDLLEHQQRLREQSLDEARRQTSLLEQHAEEVRRQTAAIEHQSEVAEAHLQLAYLTAKREEQARRLMWMETTDTGRRYAAVEHDSRRLLDWVEETNASVADNYVEALMQAELLDDPRDPAEQRRIAATPLPATPQVPSRAAERARATIVWVLKLLPIIVVVLVGYVLLAGAVLDAGMESGSQFWIRFNEWGESGGTALALIVGVPAVLLLGLTILLSSRLARRPHRDEARRTAQEHAAAVADVERRRAAARAWLAGHDQRRAQYGFDPLIEDTAAHEGWLTAMRGALGTPREVADILRAIVEVDHHQVTAELLRQWEAFLSSIVVDPRDGSGRRLLLTGAPAEPPDGA